MRKPLNKRPVPPLLSSPEVEQMLRASAEWEPDATPPSDFAAFTRQALEKRKSARRAAWARRFGGAGGMRSPLAVGLASACVLWMGGRLNSTHEAVTNAAPVSYAGASAFIPASVGEAFAPRLTLVANETVEPVKAAAPQTAPLLRYRVTPAARSLLPGRSHSKTNTVRPLWHTETVEVDKPSTESSADTAPVWKTETVERAAWGALVPVPTAAECAVPSSDEQTGEETSEPAEGEASSAILPVVLDVALPDVEPPMPAPSPSPTPSPLPEK